jgi:hypothetical protein
MAQDIIATEAWSCDFCDGCKQGWHVANYWIDGRRYTVDRYSDGDHESISKRDLPTDAEVVLSWIDYAGYVAETGLDPLANFRVPATVTRKERYTATFRRSILGAVLVKVVRGGKSMPIRSLPERVAEYLCVERANEVAPWCFVGGEGDQWAALVACEGVRERATKVAGREARITFTLDHKVPRPAATVERELRQAARRHLREKV